MIIKSVQTRNNVYKKFDDKSRSVVLKNQCYRDNFQKSISLYTAKKRVG